MSKASAQVTFEPQTVQSAAVSGVDFKVIFQDYKIHFADGEFAGSESFGTRMFAEYKTSNLSDLENYGVVQFIRGCEYETEYKNNKIVYFNNVVTDSFNVKVPFVFPHWIVDSVDSDPMYNNTPSEYLQEWKTRHGLYRWNKSANSFDENSEVWVYNQAPSTPRLYVVDHPGTAFFEPAFDGSPYAKNISLAFETCLFKTEHLPLISTPTQINPKNALKCFGWKSSFVYNFQTKVFDHPDQIAPYCLSK